MVTTARTRFPEDMTRASRGLGVATLEQRAEDALEWVKDYARDEPISFALWTLGIGFVLGWKLKPW